MKDHIRVAETIERVIEAIRQEGALSEDLIKKKAESAAKYDCELEKAVAALKASNVAVSIIDRRAKGKVSEFLYDKIIAEESLKAHFHRLDYLKAQLNGYQSVNRYLEHTTGQ